MLQVSDAYKELVKSNIRPKCEPIIKVSGIDNTGKEIELVWNAKNIKDLKYKRSIDPIGRELPYMELTWTEIYTGKLNNESYPEKYNNVTRYMVVELSFVQDLGFYNTWKTLFNGEIKWKDLFSKKATWKQLKNQVSQEIIPMPKMFLSAKPTISGQTITWTAKDLMFFLDSTQVKSFEPSLIGENINIYNPIIYLLTNERGNYRYNKNIADCIQLSIDKLFELSKNQPNNYLTKDILFNGSTKTNIMNYASVFCLHWDFDANGAICLNELDYDKGTYYCFDKKTMFNYPIITKGTNISSYSFKHYNIEADEGGQYSKNYSSIYYYGNVPIYRFNFNKYGRVLTDTHIPQEINYALSDTPEQMTIIPINHNGYEDFLPTYFGSGETYVEDNPVNPYDSHSPIAINRLDLLCSYFNDGTVNLEFETLENLAVETNDVAYIDTNLYNNDEQIKKEALIVKTEIAYNGALREKIIAHEVTRG